VPGFSQDERDPGSETKFLKPRAAAALSAMQNAVVD
jgi:hypothetical protein